MKTTVLGVDDEYVQQTDEYGRKDALFALILYAVMVLVFVLTGKIFAQKSSTLTETYIFCVTGVASSICIGLVFLFCFIRKQKLITVGFSKEQALKSLTTGIILFIMVVIFGGIWPIITGSVMQTDIGLIVMSIIYYLFFIGFMEEFTVRGYIGTRLFGFFNNKRLSIVIVGIMFSLYHIPFYMVLMMLCLGYFFILLCCLFLCY